LLQDNGTNTPDITVIQNTLGVVPSITKVQTGLWEVVHNLNEVDPYTKLDIQISNNVDGVNAIICVDTGSYNPFQFEFFIRDFITGNLIDTVLRATPIQIVHLP
jgi:formylmethanofuran dehydrogenase subunit B